MDNDKAIDGTLWTWPRTPFLTSAGEVIGEVFGQSIPIQDTIRRSYLYLSMIVEAKLCKHGYLLEKVREFKANNLFY